MSNLNVGDRKNCGRWGMSHGKWTLERVTTRVLNCCIGNIDFLMRSTMPQMGLCQCDKGSCISCSISVIAKGL